MMRPILASLVIAAAASGAEPVPAGMPYTGGFADGSSVPLYLPDGKISIVTKYGKLAVPLSEIVRIELGFRYPEGMEAKILAAIAELGSADFKEREGAQKRLAAWGELALPGLRKAARGSDPEVVRRAEEVLVKLKAGLPKDSQDAPESDTVVTQDSSIRGTIETGTLKANTKFFGETILKLADLRSLRNKALDPDLKATPTAIKPGHNPEFFPGGGGIRK